VDSDTAHAILPRIIVAQRVPHRLTGCCVPGFMVDRSSSDKSVTLDCT
jgi:hypothetical protein